MKQQEEEQDAAEDSAKAGKTHAQKPDKEILDKRTPPRECEICGGVLNDRTGGERHWDQKCPYTGLNVEERIQNLSSLLDAKESAMKTVKAAIHNHAADDDEDTDGMVGDGEMRVATPEEIDAAYRMEELELEDSDVVPEDVDTLLGLPGVGAYTARAVACFAYGKRVPVVDTNVRRVVARAVHGQADARNPAPSRDHADVEALLPDDETAPVFSAALMELGATVCTPKKPQCAQCPVADACVAKTEGKPETYPVKTRKLKRTSEQLWLLHAITRSGDVWLMQRPQTGVWAGLYCLPVFESFDALLAALPANYHAQLQDGSVFKHVLTHKDLHLHPVYLNLPGAVKLGAAMGEGRWVAESDWPALGLPAPIRKLLAN
jgi:adenine-specific DNA glycosylase